jgi:hypothetical protein
MAKVAEHLPGKRKPQYHKKIKIKNERKVRKKRNPGSLNCTLDGRATWPQNSRPGADHPYGKQHPWAGNPHSGWWLIAVSTLSSGEPPGAACLPSHIPSYNRKAKSTAAFWATYKVD